MLLSHSHDSAGTSKVPIEGFKGLQGMNGVQRFCINRCAGQDRLPSSHTYAPSALLSRVDSTICSCFNQLDLPSYSSMKVMQEKLLTAIREGSQGFAFR